MSGPVLHHLAQGVHPGAFVQPDEPDTSQVQDGVLWVDTSTAPPYTIKVWNATEDAGWERAGAGVLVGDCLLLPGGQEICGDRPGVLRLLTPAAEHDLDATGYQLPGGHRLEVVPGGPSATVSVQSSAAARCLLATQDPFAFPSYPSGWKGAAFDDGAWPHALRPSWAMGTQIWYQDPIVDSVGDGYDDVLFRHTFDLPDGIVIAAHIDISYDTNLGTCGVNGNYIQFSNINGPGTLHADVSPDFFNPSTRNALFFEISRVFDSTPSLDYTLTVTVVPAVLLRLLHGQTGQVCWESDSAQTTIYKDGVPALVSPLPQLSAVPTTLVGQDPISRLPAFCPAPPAMTTQPAAPPVAVPDPVAAGSLRCGMAQAMTTKLADVYDQLATIVTWAVSTFVGYATTLLLNIVIDALTGPEASLFLVVADARLTLIVSSLIAEAARGVLPQLDAAAEQTVLQAAYCALSPADGQVAVSVDTLTSWSANIAAASGFVGIEQWALGELVGLISLAAWQSAAYQGGQSPSAACDGMVCP